MQLLHVVDSIPKAPETKNTVQREETEGAGGGLGFPEIQTMFPLEMSNKTNKPFVKNYRN